MNAGRIACGIVGLLSFPSVVPAGIATFDTLAEGAPAGISSAVAGPVLLGTWRIGNSFSTPQIVTTARPALLYFGPSNEFVSPLFEGIAAPAVFPMTLTETVSTKNDADFDLFVELLTNGMDDELHVLAWSSRGPIGGGGGNESAMNFIVPALGPDLIEYRIDYIKEVLLVDLQTPGSDPFGTGINTDWSVSGHYEFYGTPVPEPTTAVLLTIASLALCKRAALRDFHIPTKTALAERQS